MASQPEKINAKKWTDRICKQYNLYYIRLRDTPYVYSGGMANDKKPFDGVLCCVNENIAMEWKYWKGENFPFVKQWIEHPKKKHQFRSLLKFAKTNSGIGTLDVMFKVKGKRDLQKRYLDIFEVEKKYKAGQTHLNWREDMHDLKLLERYKIAKEKT